MSNVAYRLPTSGYPGWTPEQRKAVEDWIDAHGLDHRLVPIGSDVTVEVTVTADGSLRLETWQLVRAESGQIASCPTCPACAWHERVRVPLVAPIPARIPGEWWAPTVVTGGPGPVPDTKEDTDEQ